MWFIEQHEVEFTLLVAFLPSVLTWILIPDGTLMHPPTRNGHLSVERRIFVYFKRIKKVAFVYLIFSIMQVVTMYMLQDALDSKSKSKEAELKGQYLESRKTIEKLNNSVTRLQDTVIKKDQIARTIQMATYMNVTRALAEYKLGFDQTTNRIVELASKGGAGTDPDLHFLFSGYKSSADSLFIDLMLYNNGGKAYEVFLGIYSVVYDRYDFIHGDFKPLIPFLHGYTEMGFGQTKTLHLNAYCRFPPKMIAYLVIGESHSATGKVVPINRMYCYYPGGRELNTPTILLEDKLRNDFERNGVRNKEN